MIHMGNGVHEIRPEDYLPRCVPAKDISSTFIKIPVVVACTVVVFILLIAGTATTAISYPPEPPKWRESEDREDSPQHDRLSLHTALDGDYKLLGPLLIMAGGFLLIVDVALCTIVIKEAYTSLPPPDIPSDTAADMAFLGGPFYLALPSAGYQNSARPFAFTRELWAMPNAPAPDYATDAGPLKGSRVRPATATLSRVTQLPFNPDIEVSKTPEMS